MKEKNGVNWPGMIAPLLAEGLANSYFAGEGANRGSDFPALRNSYRIEHRRQRTARILAGDLSQSAHQADRSIAVNESEGHGSGAAITLKNTGGTETAGKYYKEAVLKTKQYYNRDVGL